MGSQLPFLSEAEFRRRLHQFLPAGCPGSTSEILYSHYLELRRWNPRLSLVGPGTAEEVVERHYGESLAALTLLRSRDRSLLDIGSGAGFPGLVLAAAQPTLGVTLVEPRERKWAFLKTAIRRCGLSSRCLNVRVGRPLPQELPCPIDVVTCRALTISQSLVEALLEGSPRLRLLLWYGIGQPDLPDCSVVREIALFGSKRRRILEIEAT